jgi:restriction system protein
VCSSDLGEIPDISQCTSLDDVRDLVAAALPNDKPQAHTNYAAQLWTLKDRMSDGDLVVLPRKGSAQLAIGRVIGPYNYRSSEADPARRHTRPVEWLRIDVPRSAVKQDLLYSLGAFMTYCEVSRNEAARRIAVLAGGGTDPGTTGVFPGGQVNSKGSDDFEASDAPVGLEQFAKDRITAVIQQEFAGHRMQDLVAAVLEAEGFTCRMAPEGADGGIDILAGSGPLGMDEPRLVVQVKSEQQAIQDPVVTQLLGSVSKHQPAQGLLVAWGGLTSPARKTLLDNYFRIRAWDSEELIEQITGCYEKLPEEIRAALPLKQVWMTVEESE